MLIQSEANTEKRKELSKIIPTDVRPFYWARFDVRAFSLRLITETEKRTMYLVYLCMWYNIGAQGTQMVVIAVRATQFMAVVSRSSYSITIIIYSITLKYLCLVKHTFRILLNCCGWCTHNTSTVNRKKWWRWLWQGWCCHCYWCCCCRQEVNVINARLRIR